MPLTAEDLASLEKLLGQENVLVGSRRSPYTVRGRVPDAVLAPGAPEEVSAILAVAEERGWKLTPLGGGTHQGLGHPPAEPWLGLTLRRMHQVVDYQPDDMTISVQAGVQLGTLSATLASRRQFLPLNPPLPSRCSVGGLVAANGSGPWRAGYGTVRDWLIGAHVCGMQGQVFKGGGIVVKNVAGYDMCKLLIGSLGTLGVLTELTFKVMPRPEATGYVIVPVADANAAEDLIARIMDSDLAPAVLELVDSPTWEWADGEALPEKYGWALLVEFKHCVEAVDWQQDELSRLAEEAGGRAFIPDEQRGEGARSRLRDLPALGVFSVEASTSSARLVSMAAKLLGVTQQRHLPVRLACHAAVGTARLSFPEIDAAVIPELVTALRDVAAAHGGIMVVVQAPDEAPPYDPWGPVGPEGRLMTELKRQFDPNGMLNPGRFVGGI